MSFVSSTQGVYHILNLFFYLLLYLVHSLLCSFWWRENMWDEDERNWCWEGDEEVKSDVVGGKKWGQNENIWHERGTYSFTLTLNLFHITQVFVII